MRNVVLPGFDLAAGVWQVRRRSDPAARALADRHYSDRSIGARTVGPPGRVLILVTRCERAAWITHYPRPDLALDRLDAFRCSLFRNEGAGLSSDLIRAAMATTADLWDDRPPDGWVTWVDTRKVNTEHPGYCFKVAGWELDRGWRSTSAPAMIRLRAPLP